MLIYIIRHGETQANKDGLLQGWLDTDLNEFGVELAKQTGKALKDVKFDVVFTSPLIRATHTAQLLVESNEKDAPIIVDSLEINKTVPAENSDWNGFSVLKKQLSGKVKFRIE